MLFVHLGSGLANRLRVMASIYQLAKEYNIKAEIGWDLREELNCRFESILRLNTDLLHIRHRDMMSSKFSKYYHIFMAQHFYRKISSTEESIQRFLKAFRKNPNKKFRIETCFNFMNAKDYSFISPATNISDRVDALLKNVNTVNLVGVQIRRTDLGWAIQHSPLSLFTEKMNNELQINSNTTFYLATDDMTVREQVINQFGSKVIYNPAESVTRNNELGMIDAATDFFALTRCHKIYGSFMSSFSEEAAVIGGSELIVIHD